MHPIDAITVGMQIASALAAVHALGLIHRDVKPDNILFSKDRALLTDFGITRRIESDRAGHAPTLAGTGLPVGTPQYMAPEQLDGKQHVDHRADLYALGAVLYELLTGRPPHVADGPYAVAARVLHDPVVPPSQLNPAIWPELDAVVMRALARDPGDRYANAASMRDALQRIDQQYRSDMTISRGRSGGTTETEETVALPRSAFPSRQRPRLHRAPRVIFPGSRPWSPLRCQPSHSLPHHFASHRHLPRHSPPGESRMGGMAESRVELGLAVAPVAAAAPAVARAVAGGPLAARGTLAPQMAPAAQVASVMVETLAAMVHAATMTTAVAGFPSRCC